VFVVNFARLSAVHRLRGERGWTAALGRISMPHNTRIDGDAVNRARHAQR
jgi:hypothetical protein